MSLAFFSSSQANLSWTFLQYLPNVTDMLSQPLAGAASEKVWVLTSELQLESLLHRQVC